jgi:DNA-binding response OmpR family regulator
MRGKARILVIEDQPEVLNLMVKALTRAGCEVAGAQTGAEGLQLAEGGAFDLITLDVDLPETNGFEICSHLKQNPQLRQTPVVFVSGRFADEDVRRGREVGAVDYIVKPFELLSFVSRILTHTRRTTTHKEKMPI